jgi:hypothetical protein
MTTDEQARQQAAAGLLQELLATLRQQGWERVAVDRYAGFGYALVHHYSGGDWELKIQRPEGVEERNNRTLIRWSWRHDTLPTVTAVLSQIRGNGPDWVKAEATA